MGEAYLRRVGEWQQIGNGLAAREARGSYTCAHGTKTEALDAHDDAEDHRFAPDLEHCRA